MTPTNAYPCALCDRSFDDEVAFRRHLEDVHGFFDSQGVQAPVPASGAGMLSWLPGRGHGLDRGVPFLAVLVPLGAVVVLVQWWRGEPLRLPATAAGAIAPVLVVYALLRGQGLALLRVADVGAY